ncbi:MAG: NB-ARC domain-containing protein [Xenococcaceae cyanobacterium]
MQIKLESKSEFDFEKVLTEIDRAIKPAYLNKVQELVLRHTYEGKTYSQIATTYCYEKEYIKTVGCELWRLLSKSFDRPINKANFTQFIRYYTHTERTNELFAHFVPHESKIFHKKRQDWGTAPQIVRCLGRNCELEKLSQWIEDEQCRIVFVTSAIGLGKTTLVVKFAEQIQKQFDCVIWRSLQNAPSVDKLVDDLLCFFSKQHSEDSLDTIDSKILRLLSYLDQYRCLIVLDDLHTILDSGNNVGQYRNDCQQYAQLLNSLASARHRSTSIAIGWDKPKEFDSPSREQVRHLVLEPLQSSILERIFGEQLPLHQFKESWQLLCDRYACNPKLLEIAISTIQKYFDGNIEQFFLLKPPIVAEIRDILDLQFERLSKLERKIAYLLALEYSAVNPDKISLELITNVSRIDLLKSLAKLEQLYLIDKQETVYLLSPLAKDYLKCKLFEQICEQLAKSD